MSAAEATALVRDMIHREARGPGDYENAMTRLEAKYGIGFWTLDHFRRNKAKTCDVGLYARIKAACADHCGRHAKRLLQKAEAMQAVEHNEDVADIQRQIEALATRLEASKDRARAAK